jgi:hypothetical protein
MLQLLTRFLGGGCLVQVLHVDTEAHRDLSVFQLLAWCQRLDLILPIMGLFIPEPAAVDQSQLLEKKGLLYPVRLRVAAGSRNGGSPPSSPPTELEQGRR